MTDVLYVSLGTTFGLRVADGELVGAMRRAGASVEVVSIGLGALDRLRKGYPVNDWIEAGAARRVIGRAVARTAPRAVVVSTTTAALLAPRMQVPFAVRLDSPACVNRLGIANAPQRALERAVFARARAIVPFSRAAQALLPAGSAPAVVVPPPTESKAQVAGPREPKVVAYTPDCRAKGLDIACSAWALAETGDARLELFGIDEDEGRRQLAARGVEVPAGVVWRGRTPAASFRNALAGARLFVQAARWEDYGQAPLEALADGAAVVTVPSAGPYEALAIARRLAPELVSGSVSAADLAPAIERGLGLTDGRLEEIRNGAARELEPYRPRTIDETVARELLPRLIG